MRIDALQFKLDAGFDRHRAHLAGIGESREAIELQAFLPICFTPIQTDVRRDDLFSV